MTDQSHDIPKSGSEKTSPRQTLPKATKSDVVVTPPSRAPKRNMLSMLAPIPEQRRHPAKREVQRPLADTPRYTPERRAEAPPSTPTASPTPPPSLEQTNFMSTMAAAAQKITSHMTDLSQYVQTSLNGISDTINQMSERLNNGDLQYQQLSASINRLERKSAAVDTRMQTLNDRLDRKSDMLCASIVELSSSRHRIVDNMPCVQGVVVQDLNNGTTSNATGVPNRCNECSMPNRYSESARCDQLSTPTQPAANDNPTNASSSPDNMPTCNPAQGMQPCPASSSATPSGARTTAVVSDTVQDTDELPDLDSCEPLSPRFNPYRNTTPQPPSQPRYRVFIPTAPKKGMAVPGKKPTSAPTCVAPQSCNNQ
jgi:hypothetical protein